jgi:protein O-GlcNAc transferase
MDRTPESRSEAKDALRERTQSGRVKKGKPTPEGRSPRTVWIIGIVAAILLIAGIGWRLHRRAPAPAPPAIAGVSISPQEGALQREAEQKPRDPAPWRKLGEFYFSEEQPFEAIWAFQEARERDPGDTVTLAHLAEALEAGTQYRLATDIFAEVLRRAPENRKARLRLARLYVRLGEATPAIETLRGAGKQLDTWADGLLALGLAQQLKGDLPEAVAMLRWHLKLSPESAEGSIRLARALLEQGQEAAARKVLQLGRLNAPRDPRFPFYLGLSWIPDGRPQKPQEAIDYFKEAFVIAPDHPLPHHYMGLLLARQGRWLEAQAHFLKATEVDPTYPDPQLGYAQSLEKTGARAGAKEQLGNYYFLKDDSYQAAEAFRSMAKVDPGNDRAARLASLAYLRLGRNDWAIREAKAALQRHPNDTELLERLATLYILNHNRPAARRTCAAWLKIQPGAARAHWLLGRVAQADLNPTEAIREFETAVAAEPSSAEYAAALAGALNEGGGTPNLRRAAGLLQQAVSQDPKNGAYRHDLGLTLQQMGDLEGARRQMLAALDRAPHDAPAYSSISQLCARLRKSELARFFAPLVRAEQDRSREELRFSRRIGQDPTNPEAHAAYASFLIRAASFPAAESHLERALELRPNYPEARAELAYVKRVISVR